MTDADDGSTTLNRENPERIYILADHVTTLCVAWSRLAQLADSVGYLCSLRVLSKERAAVDSLDSLVVTGGCRRSRGNKLGRAVSSSGEGSRLWPVSQ
jgi:hypothetical protein